MWHKFKEQIPAVIVTAVLVIAAAAIMVKQIAKQQQAELVPLKAQNESLAALAEENRRQIAATTKLLKEALAQNAATALQPEAGVEKINEERLTRLAQVIAERVIPAMPSPKSPADIEAAQNAQVDKVADRLAANIKPALADAIAEQKAASLAAVQTSERRVRELNVGLLATQAAAQDAVRLSRELSALYADSIKDQGVVMRLFSLPASLLMDAGNLRLVGGNRAKVEREMAVKVAEIEKRLNEVRALASDGTN